MQRLQKVKTTPKKSKPINIPKNVNNNNNNNNNSRKIEYAPMAIGQKQSFPHKPMRSRRIQNSELVASITGSVAFSASQSFAINPGLPASFPWLSVLAKQWEQYRFHSLCYRYVTRTATDEKGSIILSPEYNPRDLPPTTESQASNTQDAVEDVIWRNLECHLDATSMFPLGPRKQIRSTNLSGDMSVYDAGRIFICTTGEDSTDEIGKLWVDYDVELYVPQNSPSEYTGPISTSVFYRDAIQANVSGVATAMNWNIQLYDPLRIGTGVGGVFTPPAGCYLFRGFIGLGDDTDEDLISSVTIHKNGSPLTYPAVSYEATANGIAPQALVLPFSQIVTCSGTDTVSVVIVMVGAAGALTAAANRNILLITLA